MTSEALNPKKKLGTQNGELNESKRNKNENRKNSLWQIYKRHQVDEQ
jgi:hypothetical protein